MTQPNVIVYPTESEVVSCATQIVIKQLQKKPTSTLVIAGGNSTKGLLQELINAYQKQQVNFEKAIFIGLDEYYPIKPDHPISTLVRARDFFAKCNLKSRQVVFPDGTTNNIQTEVKRFKNELEKHSPIDLSILGIGPGKTCHIGMNNPGSTKDSQTRLVSLDNESRNAMKKKLNLPDSEVPHSGITLGMKEILKSKEILLIALGEKKAWGIKRSLEGEINSEAPASFLRYHSNTTVLLDTVASKLLK